MRCAFDEPTPGPGVLVFWVAFRAGNARQNQYKENKHELNDWTWNLTTGLAGSGIQRADLGDLLVLL